MNALCPACTRGPSGIDGHADLGVLTIGEMLSFKCRGCEALWSREGLGRGAFAWAPVGDRDARSRRMGLLVPPRSTPQPA